METWPAQFQELLNEESFGYKYGDTTVRSDMDVGPQKVRARYTQGIDTYTCTITLDIDLLDEFEDFYKVTLGNGVRTFEFNDPITQVPSEFQFTEPPDIRPIGGRTFIVNMRWIKVP